MANRSIHYEAALEDFLRVNGVAYVATNEAKRALRAGLSLKSVDFIVSVTEGENFLVEVKGKRFPYVRRHGRNYWESWLHREDLVALMQWSRILGASFRPLVVFVYHLVNPFDRRVQGPQFATLHRFRGNDYALMGIDPRTFSRLCRSRSEAWDAVDVPVEPFMRHVRPFDFFLGRPEAVGLFPSAEGGSPVGVTEPGG